MLTKNILYQRVNSVCPVERSVFEEDLCCAANELCAMFGEKYVLDHDCDLQTRQEYFTALCSAILYFRTGDQTDRRRFLDRAKTAFLTIWRGQADSRRRGADHAENDR
ncbi:MAG: hypothetical protein IJY89_03360 [Clostridia bacterium]|nr:hypothetical protein [Clostridia bacterium]